MKTKSKIAIGSKVRIIYPGHTILGKPKVLTGTIEGFEYDYQFAVIRFDNCQLTNQVHINRLKPININRLKPIK